MHQKTRMAILTVVLVTFAFVLGACFEDALAPGSTETTGVRATAGTGVARTPAVAASPSSASATTVLAPAALPELELRRVASGLQRPTFVTVTPGAGDGRLYVIEKSGQIRTIRNGQVDPMPFIDIRNVVNASGNEQGLLGLAFHPDYAANGRFFVTYTAKDGGANTLAEYRADPASGRADPASGAVLLAVPDKFPNHNGGMIAFGRDGYLYLSEGDGGSAGDPDRNGQSLGALLGKILRLDVDGAKPYAIPASNPFVSRDGARPEIWAYGLRNPWRFSFDRATGDLWIADVGQNAREEINLQSAASKGGENYGWSIMEGAICYRPASGCDRSGLVMPVHDYSHDAGCSITGGYVYRGKAIPALAGAYTFVDYCEGVLKALRKSSDGTWATVDLLRTDAGISSFGEDAAGELYLTGDRDGTLYQLTAK